MARRSQPPAVMYNVSKSISVSGWHNMMIPSAGITVGPVIQIWYHAGHSLQLWNSYALADSVLRGNTNGDSTPAVGWWKVAFYPESHGMALSRFRYPEMPHHFSFDHCQFRDIYLLRPPTPSAALASGHLPTWSEPKLQNNSAWNFLPGNMIWKKSAFDLIKMLVWLYPIKV